MVMRNAISLIDKGNRIRMVFDLKGSRYRRQVFSSDAPRRTFKMGDSVMKDVDLVNYTTNYDQLLINLSINDRREIMKQIKEDVELLA